MCKWLYNGGFGQLAKLGEGTKKQVVERPFKAEITATGDHWPRQQVHGSPGGLAING